MTELPLHDYIDYIRAYEKPSPYTLDIYERSLKACELEKVDTSPEGLNKVWDYLAERLDTGKTKYGFIQNAVAVIKANLELNDIEWNHSRNYKILLAKLRQARPPTKRAYTDEQIAQLLRAVQYDPPVFNACLLMALSACRIGGTKGVRFDQFETTELPGVRVWECNSKGRRYIAAISEYGFEQLLLHNTRNSKFVVQIDDGYSSEYADVIRNRLLAALDRENKLAIRAGASTLHSIRKWAIGKLQMSNLAPDAVSRLAGHAVKNFNRITEKNYVDANTYTDAWKNYIAGLYAKSSLMTWRLL